jgi:hypothetical protein
MRSLRYALVAVLLVVGCKSKSSPPQASSSDPAAQPSSTGTDKAPPGSRSGDGASASATAQPALPKSVVVKVLTDATRLSGPLRPESSELEASYCLTNKTLVEAELAIKKDLADNGWKLTEYRSYPAAGKQAKDQHYQIPARILAHGHDMALLGDIVVDPTHARCSGGKNILVRFKAVPGEALSAELAKALPNVPNTTLVKSRIDDGGLVSVSEYCLNSPDVNASAAAVSAFLKKDGWTDLEESAKKPGDPGVRLSGVKENHLLRVNVTREPTKVCKGNAQLWLAVTMFRTYPQT